MNSDNNIEFENKRGTYGASLRGYARKPWLKAVNAFGEDVLRSFGKTTPT